MSKKPRADSPLNRLPPKRQEAIEEHALAHTLAETVAWLHGDGLDTSSTALSAWLASRRLGHQLAQNGTTVERLLAALVESDPDISQEKLDKAGQMFFTSLAIEQQDSLSWQRAQNVKIKEAALALESRRIAVLEKKAAQADATEKVVTDDQLSPEQRAARIREIYGRA